MKNALKYDGKVANLEMSSNSVGANYPQYQILTREVYDDRVFSIRHILRITPGDTEN